MELKLVTRVVNMKKEPCDVSIMRPGPFGNPHPIGWCAACRESHTRRTAIECFKQEFRLWLTSIRFKRQLEELKGKTLGCVCKPLACHGDVIVQWLEKTGDFAPRPEVVEEQLVNTHTTQTLSYGTVTRPPD